MSVCIYIFSNYMVDIINLWKSSSGPIENRETLKKSTKPWQEERGSVTFKP